MKYRSVCTRSRVVAALCAALLSMGTLAQAQVTYLEEDFESYSPGVYSAIGNWAGDEDAISITNYTYAFTPSAGFPLSGSAHTRVMEIAGSVSNALFALAVPPEPQTTTWVDMLVKPRFLGEDDDYPTDIPTTTQTAMVFDHEGHLHIYHFLSDDWDAFDGVGTTTWSRVDNAALAVEEGHWVRLSIESNYEGEGILGFTFFRVLINGTVVSHTNAYVDPWNFDFSSPGEWFEMATTDGSSVPPAEQLRLNAIMLGGTGFFDDVVVTEVEPTFEAFVYYQITPGVVGKGSISPDEVQYVLEGEDSVAFTFSADSGYVLSGVVVVENGETNNLGDAVADYTFTDVQANGAITAYFVLDSSASQPSSDWFMLTGIDPEELGDDRGDGMTYREAWLASINPNDTNETFRIIGAGRAGGSNYVQWVSTYVDIALPPFAIWARTNLMDTTYTEVGGKARVAGDPISAPVTNTWWGETPTHPIFYRVAATNTPPDAPPE